MADTVGYLLSATLPVPAPSWPADAFAVAASLLKASGAYTEIINRWPPNGTKSVDGWHAKAVRIRHQWRDLFTAGKKTAPPQVLRWWKVIMTAGAVPISQIALNRSLLEALLGIMAAADQTCHGVGVLMPGLDRFDNHAIGLLTLRNTLCEEVDASRAVVLPKLHNPLDGMTIRSLTHNLALWDRPEVTPVWSQLALPELAASMNVLVFPWPLVVAPHSLRETTVTPSALMPDRFGLFTYEMPKEPVNIARIRMLLQHAEELVGKIDAVVFPEMSLSERDFQRVLLTVGTRLLVSGIGSTATSAKFGQNAVAIGIASKFGSRYRRGTYRQSKHHRWRLDRGQLSRYGFGARFGSRDSWWEAIPLSSRRCTFFTANEWLTFCVLICEDLARQDPVAELVRCVGPNLVIALLMDGPQIPERWSARYATVLAEDPRSSVLTLASVGLVDLARSQYGSGPRSVGLWKDALSGDARQIVLDPGAEAIVLGISAEKRKEWTADGRHDDGTTGYLRLTGIHQVYPR